jgi:NitT/TauT family transport system permease protein
MVSSRRRNDRLLRVGLPTALAAVVLLAWQYGIRVVGVPKYLVATPSDVAVSLVEGFRDGTLFRDTAATLEEIVLGFALGATVGIALGVLVSWSRLIDETLTPYIIALNGFPKVAIAPLLVVLLGQGLPSKILITALVAFFPLVVNVTAGLNATRSDQLDLMRSLTASRWQLFSKVQMQMALPQVFAGLKIAIVLAPVGAIVGEFVGAQQGLGYAIQVAIEVVRPADEFAIFVILTLISLLLFQIVKVVEAKVVFWNKSGGEVISA